MHWRSYLRIWKVGSWWRLDALLTFYGKSPRRSQLSANLYAITRFSFIHHLLPAFRLVQTSLHLIFVHEQR